MQTVIETARFTKSAKASGVTAEELATIITTLAGDPERGDLMQGTGGARMVRFARNDTTGKRGGYRIITYFGGSDIPLFLLDIFGKGQKANLSKADRNVLATLLPKIGPSYRAGTKAAAVKRVKREESRT